MSDDGFSDLSVRTALYHHERGRKFRPSSFELETEQFSCPYCSVTLTKVRMRAEEYGFCCPKCRWTIHRDDIWNPDMEEEPDVRAPGDATEGPTPAEMSAVTPPDLVEGPDVLPSIEEIGLEDIAPVEEEPVQVVIS